ncbi:MAG TPA: ABC transporter substrate-binding protein [Dehalococcoidia bacterium]|nr:ABC transporter substrate-binding protein [Dehalococcoidia bacterium]
MQGGYWTSGRRTRRQILRAAVSVALPPLLGGCSGGVTPPAARTATRRSAQPARGGTLTLRSFSDVSVLDYAFNHDVYSGFVIGNCVETLVTHDSRALPQGLLASGWETPDATTYVFHLQDRVRFQDGSALTSTSVDYSLDRVRADKTAVRHSDLDPVDKITLPDALTLRQSLGTPFSPFLEKLTGDAGRVISQATGERYGKDRLRLDLTNQGSGPFRFGGREVADRVVLLRNADYWGRDARGERLPYLDRIVVRVIPDDTLALASLRRGEVDAFRPTEGPPPKDTAAVKRDPALTYAAVPGVGFSYMAFNCAREPFDRTELRQAVNYAIDRQEIASRVLYNTVEPLDVVFGPSIWTAESGYHPYLKRDIGAAKRLLAQAGRPNGFSFALLISAGSPELQSLAELIQQHLREAGIDATIRQVEFAKLTQSLNAGEHQAAFLGWTANYDPDEWVYPLFSSKGSVAARIGYRSAEVDRLLEQARTTLDAAGRTGLYQRAQRRIVDDAAVCVLYDKLNANVSATSVEGLPLGPTPAVGVSQAWKAG